MEITYKQLENIEYPAFKLPSDNWSLQDGLLYLDAQVLDDRNMPGKTLGIRRLQTPFRDLVKLKKAATAPISLIKNPSGSYIDSLGRIFTYEKTEFVQLKYHKIRKTELKDTYTLLWVSNFNFPIKVPRPPHPGYTWAGVLYMKGFPWLLYEYSEQRKKSKRKKV